MGMDLCIGVHGMGINVGLVCVCLCDTLTATEIKALLTTNAIRSSVFKFL